MIYIASVIYPEAEENFGWLPKVVIQRMGLAEDQDRAGGWACATAVTIHRFTVEGLPLGLGLV